MEAVEGVEKESLNLVVGNSDQAVRALGGGAA
jgi:hypothetical protein